MIPVYQGKTLIGHWWVNDSDSVCCVSSTTDNSWDTLSTEGEGGVGEAIELIKSDYNSFSGK